MPEPDPNYPKAQENTLITPLPAERPEEERLREEVRSLRHQLDQANRKPAEHPGPERPKRRTLWILAMLVVTVFALAFLLGYLPRHRREAELQKETRAEEHALPVVSYVAVKLSPPNSTLLLPGTMQGLVDTPILARADGYLKKWYVDIGDHVRENQLMAEIEAPDLDQQVRQARAQLLQAQAALKQADANLEQGRANESLAQVTARRWAGLLKRGAVSKQENDQFQTNYAAQTATVGALIQAVGAAREYESAAQANLDRLLSLQAYEQIRAPVNGTVTVRNIDIGALITTGNTLLYRVAQLARLRTYIFVPQTNAPMVQIKQPANLYVSEYPGRGFRGVVTRTADALDPGTRTLLTEVQVDNPTGLLHPGMFTTVTLNNTRRNPPALIPSEALLIRAEGAFVATLINPEQPANPPSSENKKADKTQQVIEEQQQLANYTVHLVSVNMGRDFGNEIEILSGLKDGNLIVATPTDAVREGAKVKGQPVQGNVPSSTGSENTERLIPQPKPEPPKPESKKQ
jgi:RND family efflux transporter MFP subunit